MFGDFEKSIGETIDAIISNPFVQLALQAIAFYIVLVWLLTAFWAFRDMQHRTTNPVAPYLAAGIIIAFTPFLFLFAVVLYRIVRPRETIAEANERALAEEAILAEIKARPHCANCSRAVEEEWIICPTCRNRLRRVCPNGTASWSSTGRCARGAARTSSDRGRGPGVHARTARAARGTARPDAGRWPPAAHPGARHAGP